MSVSLVWLAVPLAPLLFLMLLMIFPAALNRITPWIVCSCVPAFYCSWLPPDSLSPGFLWRGASFGSDDILVSSWLGLTSVLWAASGWYAAFSMSSSQHRLRFWTFWLVSLSGSLLLVIAQDALSFYVGFSLMSLSAYGLVIHDGTSAARRAGRLYLQLAILGEVLLLSGLLMRAHAAQGSFNFSDWINVPVDPLTAVLLLTGLGLKAGFWPLHVWLPLAHPAAPAPASAVLSGAMVKAGIFGIWLFLPTNSSELTSANWSLSEWSLPVMIVGMFSAIYGVASGLFRDNPKQVLAYSSVSQMGYLLFILALSWQLPEQRETILLVLLVYAVHHGFAKTSLFLSVDLLKSGYVVSFAQKLVLIAGVLIPSLALGGLIFSSGAAAKTGLKEVLENAGLLTWLPWLQVGAVTSTLLLARACYLLFKLSHKAEQRPLPPQRLVIWACLALMPVVLPWLWLPMTESLLPTLVFYKLVELSWPVLLAIAAAWFVIWRQWRVPDFLIRLSNPFLLYSIRFARRSNKSLLPDAGVSINLRPLRALERRWNRYWQGGTVNRSAVSVVFFLVVAVVFMLVF